MLTENLYSALWNKVPRNRKNAFWLTYKTKLSKLQKIKQYQSWAMVPVTKMIPDKKKFF